MSVEASSSRAPKLPAPSTTPPKSSSSSDPILRNALRYTISAREYALLHKYVLSRSRVLRRRAPSVQSVERIMEPRPVPGRRGSAGVPGKGKGKETDGSESSSREIVVVSNDYNVRAVRHALRVFVVTILGMKGYEVVMTRLLKRNANEPASKSQKQSLFKSPTLRLSLSLSTILLLYRLLFRFLTRLRAQLLDPSALPFRQRNPRTANALTSPYTPAIGASLAGLALGIIPAAQLRVSIAIYALFRALEYGWNTCEDQGQIWGFKQGPRGATVKRDRPWWWGSWMLQPLAFGQLLHAVVFDRDCYPTTYGDFIWSNSTAYLHKRPREFPSNMKWPSSWDVVDSLAQMAKLNWPPYISPTLFPNQETLPASLSVVAPLTSPAHPLITSLSCATLHPSDPSCLRTYLTFWVRSFPRLARVFLLFYSAMLLPRYKALYNAPLSTLNRLLARTLRLSTFLTGAISTAWASICFFQAWFPRSFLSTQRFFLGGFLAGMWAFVDRRNGRGVFMYSARTSVDSLWKVGVKRRWWRAMKGGDVWVFVLAVMITGVVYERDAMALRESSWRKGVSWVRGEGWKDWGVEEDEVVDKGE